ncbi:UNVERIFIED_CONTAM: hypothetical protein RMT77_013296 [Armadillidium vulgare]
MVFSLQNICSNIIAVDICNDPDVKKQIFCYSLYPESPLSLNEKWKTALQIAVNKKLNEFQPGLLPLVPTCLFSLIGFKMVKWAYFMKSKFGLSLEFSQDFIRTSHFTTQGNVDEKAAAKDLVHYLGLNLVLRYKIACYYYLEDSILILWPQLPDMEPAVYNKLDPEPFNIWTDYLEKKSKFSTSESELRTLNNDFHTEISLSPISRTNVAAIKYVFDAEKSMNWNENSDASSKKKINICSYISYPKFYFQEFTSSFHELLISHDLEERCNIMAFYMCQMANGNLSNFKADRVAPNALRYLLIWPNQHLFMIAADLLFQYLNPDKYFELLIDIISLIENPDFGNTFDYRDLLREFWTKSPSYLKKHVIDIETGRHFSFKQYLFRSLFDLNNFTFEDEYNFLCILEHATSSDKYGILNCQGRSICSSLIKRKKKKLAENFIKNFILEEEKQKTFIREILNFYSYLAEEEEEGEDIEESHASDPFYRKLLKKIFY